jgi:hypothetical protein
MKNSHSLYTWNKKEEKRPPGRPGNGLRSLCRDYPFFSAFGAAFLAVRPGRDLPKLPVVIFPRLVRLSPLPII